ncbi:MAG: EMC3/TMCO1 family protein [Candidatus Nanohaloarchaea archaeon]|nr:EMC3/TMCO1 family protein [Candidatus Nanohaloarchaea archaeon]
MTYGFLYDAIIPLLAPTFPLFDLVFGPFFALFDLSIAPQLALGALSILLAALVSVVYYIMIDKEKYDRIKQKQQKYQDKIKEAKENDEMDKVNKYISENMKLQKDFMKVSLKPILGSMLLFFLFMPWVLHTFVPVTTLQPAQQGDGYTGNLTFLDGQYNLGELQATAQNNDTYILQHGNETYREGNMMKIRGMSWQVQNIQVQDSEAAVKLSLSFLHLPFSLPLAGDSLEWLGFYIIFQLPFTFIFRKMLGLQ